jgi:hypothetical protein
MYAAFSEESFIFERPWQPAPSVLIHLINFPSSCPCNSSVRKKSQSVTINSVFLGTDIATLISTWFTPAPATELIALMFLKEIVDSLPTQIPRSAFATSVSCTSRALSPLVLAVLNRD